MKSKKTKKLTFSEASKLLPPGRGFIGVGYMPDQRVAMAFGFPAEISSRHRANFINKTLEPYAPDKENWGCIYCVRLGGEEFDKVMKKLRKAEWVEVRTSEIGPVVVAKFPYDLREPAPAKNTDSAVVH